MSEITTFLPENLNVPCTAGHDLEESTKIEEACDFCQLCAQSLPLGLFVFQYGQVKYANATLAELLACDLEQLLGISPVEFVHPADREQFQTNLRRTSNGESTPSRLECRVLSTQGAVLETEILLAPTKYQGEPAVMGMLVDVSACKRSQREREELLQFERLLADLSARFVNASAEQIDSLIDESLKVLVEFLGNDRSTFVEFDEDPEQVQVTHCYTVPSCASFPLGPFSVDQLPWFIGHFRGRNPVFVKNIPADLPPEAVKEAQYCQAHGIQSNVTVPLQVGGLALGGLTFAFLRRRCEWNIEIIKRLQLIGQVFANALLRRRTEVSLRAALEENEKLSRQLEEENLYLRDQIALKHHHARIIGGSTAILRVLSDSERVAATDSPVLLLGETGTGKELLAQTIHELSRRHARPMVILNCASLPATLVESELFGREAGAYTGAASAQVGRFAVADGSTLFLDEIGEIPLELQSKLLRVLQDGRFERLGSPKSVKVDVRIIAATNRDLEQAVCEGRFRADLYHRLNVFPIQVPPLRERRDDIPALAWAFVETLSRRMGKSIKTISRKTMQQLQQYSWPGNVRELSNIIERAMILATSDTLHVQMPADLQSTAPHRSLKESEREQILRALQETGWRIRGAGGTAEILGIKPTTLEARMAKLDISRPNRNPHPT